MTMQRLMNNTLLRLFAFFCFITVSPVRAAEFSAENAMLRVKYDDSTHEFSVAEKASGKTFLIGGRLEGKDIGAVAESATDVVFGRGRKITVTQADGSRITLALYKKLAFLLIGKELLNGAPAEVDVQKIVPVAFTLDLGKPANALKTLGTGGLFPPGQNPGSYLFLTCADPATRNGVVTGWLTQNRGSGVVFSSVKGQAVELKAQLEYGHLRIPAGKSVVLETLAIGYFNDARLGEEAYADAIKKQYNISLRPQQSVYCSWYAEQHGQAGDEKSTVDLARFAAKELKPYGFGIVQIDDEWQDGPKINGPRRGFDRHRPDGPYPRGMQSVAAEVEKLGMTFGLWWLPFARNYQDPEYKDRQHWFVKRLDGKPYDTVWGGTSLDLTHPEVKAQIALMAKRLRTWGVKYYKMDGLWTGTASEQIYVNDGYKDDHFGNNQPFHDPWVSNIEAFRGGLKLIRTHAGDDVFFSGCNVSQNMRSLGGSIGLVDTMRIGPDYNADGKGAKTGPLRGSRLYFMNGRLWWNDPDPCIVRASGQSDMVGPVTLPMAKLGASWVAIAGQFALNSDWLPALPPERLEVLKRTMSYHGATARPVDCFDNDLPATWLVTDDKSGVQRNVIGLFNFDATELNVSYPCVTLGIDPGKTYHAFDFWENAPIPDFRGEFAATVKPASCRVIAVRAAEGHPVLVSTSRHVSQGILEVKEEEWSRGTLSGVSEVVGGDAYELRIAGLRDGGKQWRPLAVMVSKADRVAGVKVSFQEGAGLLRVKISSPANRDVKWSVRFEDNALHAEN